MITYLRLLFLDVCPVLASSTLQYCCTFLIIWGSIGRWNYPQYLLTPWSRVLLEKLIGSQLVQNCLAFYETWRFITTPPPPGLIRLGLGKGGVIQYALQMSHDGYFCHICKQMDVETYGCQQSSEERTFDCITHISFVFCGNMCNSSIFVQKLIQ